MAIRRELDLERFGRAEMREERDMAIERSPQKKSRAARSLERRVDERQLAARGVHESVRHRILAIRPRPIRDIDEDRVKQRVGGTLPRPRLHPRPGRCRIHGFRRITKLQIVDDVGRVDDRQSVVGQHRDLDAAINGLKLGMLDRSSPSIAVN